jgi:hypothetical protein
MLSTFCNVKVVNINEIILSVDHQFISYTNCHKFSKRLSFEYFLMTVLCSACNSPQQVVFLVEALAESPRIARLDLSGNHLSDNVSYLQKK